MARGKGLYAPNGGQNLAPRQPLREWRGGGPSAALTAQMVSEYRLRHPDKAIICGFEKLDGWGFLAAGGSFPKLPRTVAARLLAAIPRMKPFELTGGLTEKQWALAELGQQYFVYATGGAQVRLDLSAEPGKFKVHRVELPRGKVVSTDETVEAGKVVTLAAPRGQPAAIWLTR